MFKSKSVKSSMLDIVLTVATLSFSSAIASTSILAALKSDTNSCAISPNNSGCILNRPFDVKEQEGNYYFLDF